MDATSVCNFVFKKKLHKSKKPGVSVTLIYACLLLSGGGRIIILIWYFSLSFFPFSSLHSSDLSPLLVDLAPPPPQTVGCLQAWSSFQARYTLRRLVLRTVTSSPFLMVSGGPWSPWPPSVTAIWRTTVHLFKIGVIIIKWLRSSSQALMSKANQGPIFFLTDTLVH